MANYNIVAKNINVPSPSGTKIYYNLVLINESTGQIKSAINTIKQNEVEKYITEAKENHPEIKINGKKGTDPFSDGTLIKQKNYDIESAKEDLNFAQDQKSRGSLTDAQGRGSQEEGGFQGEMGSFTGPTNYASYNTLNNFDPSLPPLSARGGSDLIPTSMFNISIFEKKARDLSGVPEQKRRQFEGLSEEQRGEKNINGVFGSKRIQARTKRENTPSELVVAQGPDNNAFIIVGNDRASKPHTGYGGKGHTQCDAIDIIAGLGGHNPREVEKISIENGDSIESKVKTNPNFFLDSARIYISQKTDVDKNFGIGEFGAPREGNKDDKDNKDIGKYGAKSAVVTKADNIRIIGRESIRIVTGTDKFNSQGGEVVGKSGIELVAMNDTEALQPMVLGDNLCKLLDSIIGQVESLANISHASAKYQMKFNQAVQSHVHLSPFFAIPTVESFTARAAGIQCDIETLTKTELSTLKQSTNLQGVRNNFLLQDGPDYICSRLNKAN